MDPVSLSSLRGILPKAVAALAGSRADRGLAGSQGSKPPHQYKAPEGAAWKPNIHALLQGGAQTEKANPFSAPGAGGAPIMGRRRRAPADRPSRVIMALSLGLAANSSAFPLTMRRQNPVAFSQAPQPVANKSVKRTVSQLRWLPSAYLAR